MKIIVLHQKITTFIIFGSINFTMKSRFGCSCGGKVEISQDVVDGFWIKDLIWKGY
jgi:hypothetical protein